MSYAGPQTPARLGDAAGTLRLLGWLALAIALLVLDHQGGWMRRLRAQAGIAVEPLREVASWPGRLVGEVTSQVGTMASLARENRELRRELVLAHARMARMGTAVADNARLRELLDAAQHGALDVQLAFVLDVDLDPTRQRLLIDAGTRDGVRTGQAVIDAHGLLGQVTRVGPLQSDVLLLTDADHAVPVAIARNGVRLVAYGSGRSDLLALRSVPLSSDVRPGDLLVTSGMGGRFPPGFPVGRIVSLHPDDSRAFLVGDVRPAARLDRGREVLLLRSAPPRPPVEVTVPADPATPAPATSAPATSAPATAAPARARPPATTGGAR